MCNLILRKDSWWCWLSESLRIGSLRFTVTAIPRVSIKVSLKIRSIQTAKIFQLTVVYRTNFTKSIESRSSLALESRNWNVKKLVLWILYRDLRRSAMRWAVSVCVRRTWPTKMRGLAMRRTANWRASVRYRRQDVCQRVCFASRVDTSLPIPHRSSSWQLQ